MAEENNAQAQQSNQNQAGAPPAPEPGGFNPPQTQEAFERMLKERLERQQGTIEKSFQEKYADVFKKAEEFDKLQEQNKTDLEKANDRANAAEAKLKTYEEKAKRASWMQAAAEATGLPISLMHGETEEEIMANAQALQTFMGNQPAYPPTPNGGEPAGGQQKKMTKEDILAVKDRRERQKLMAENAELFGVRK